MAIFSLHIRSKFLKFLLPFSARPMVVDTLRLDQNLFEGNLYLIQKPREKFMANNRSFKRDKPQLN